MAKTLKPGDKVSWNTSHGETSGVVMRKVVRAAKVKSHVAGASPAHPEYEVRSARSGARAIHKPQALRKRG